VRSALLLVLMSLSVSAMADLKPVRLRCEYLQNPLGIDVPRPRLTWQVESRRRGERQTAWQILVASDPRFLGSGRGDLWDSGRVESGETAHIEYAGSPLRSWQMAWWKVRVWDRDGRPSAYSAPAFWQAGLFDKRDWQGTWIGRTREKAYQPAPLLRREFRARGGLRRATAAICGLGYYELRLNGQRVGDHQLDPGFTRYDRRALYVLHDVTRLVRPGTNALGIMLGTGWHKVHTLAVWKFHEAPWRAAPRVLMNLRLEYEDGQVETVSTDASWRTATGPVTYDSIYGGESYDARLERNGWDRPGYDDSGWQPALVVEGPGGALSAQKMPPIRVQETRQALEVRQPQPGVYVFDMGQNFAGWAELSVEGPAGTIVTLRYGERVNPDGTLYRGNIDVHLIKTDPPQRFQTDTYTLKGDGRETWHARFTYHGFQYVEVTGLPSAPTLDTLRGLVLSSDVDRAGDFQCSNPLLDRIQRATLWSYRSNLLSIPTDCPHREKNGWTGDAHLAAEQALLNFDPAAVYTKWMDDFADEQRETGELPGIVPTGGWGYEWGNGPAWDSAFLLIPHYLHLYRGDRRILERHYEGHRRYVDYLTSRAQDGIVSIGLGDWVPWKTETPVSLTSTAYYYVDARIVAATARMLGRTDDASRYEELAGKIREAFNRAFWDEARQTYANGSQTALSCALYQGLVPEPRRQTVLEQLVRNIEERGGHIDTGILGAKYVLNTLLENGRADVACRIVSQRDQPGWGWWLDQGATTLWESWQGANDSRNHIMFGDVSAWFHKALAGIRPDPAGPGFARFTVRPEVVGGLVFARGVHDSIRGRIESDWRIDKGRLHLRVRIPANTVATVHVPTRSVEAVRESGRPAGESEGIRFLRAEPGHAVFEVGSGEYHFESPGWTDAAR